MSKSPLEANLWLGIRLRAWLRLMARNWFAVRPGRWPMALLVVAASGFNSTLAALQACIYGRRIRQVEVPDDPIFILGHWRTGTTMLHELLALDPRHRAPTTYESLAPNHFLLSERFVRRFARFLLPKTRPFDNMRMSFDRPQEDEAALMLRGVPSPFLSVAFPRRPTQDAAYVDLAGLSPAKLQAWGREVRAFMRLLLFRRPGRLVLKSPQHTNRLAELAEMFPRAKFVYVVRDPFVVFPSTVHFWRTMYERYALQRHDEAELSERVLADFAAMHERIEAARPTLSPERIRTIHYEQLVAEPVAEMESLYRTLDLGNFTAAAPEVARYAERSKRYRTNEYEIDDPTRREIAKRWAAYIAAHGY